MDILETLLNVIEKTIGIERAELNEMMDVNLFEESILDSLSAVTVIAGVEKSLNKSIDLRQIPLESFSTIRTLAEAISEQVQ